MLNKIVLTFLLATIFIGLNYLHMIKKSIFLTLFFIQLSFAQSEIRFKKLSIEHGLSQSTVETIIQDQSGFMWFGTEDGLNRYDGYQFRIYKNDPDDSTSISNNNIFTK